VIAIKGANSVEFGGGAVLVFFSVVNNEKRALEFLNGENLEKPKFQNNSQDMSHISKDAN
jgi:hypothetical protein